MRTVAQLAGADAESLVVDHLRGLGWSIIGRNLRVGRAEIDILAAEPGARRTLVVVEVRWRSRRDYGLAEETVDRAKLARLRAAAVTLRDGGARTKLAVPRLPVRIDIVAVEPGRPMRHHRAVG